jgi:DNA-binding transcriptional MocR family regulator
VFLSIDKEGATAVYVQIRDRIIEMIQAGTLMPADRLPGTRELAKELGISRKTVLIAYLELAADNWVETRPGAFTYVLPRLGVTGTPDGGGADDPLARLGRAMRERAAPAPLALTAAGTAPGAGEAPGQAAARDGGVGGATPERGIDWSPYQIEGSFFGMPPHKEHWRGDEEWISFARAIPDVRLFPFERIKKVSSQMLWDPKAYFFDYGRPQGFTPLLDYLELRLAREGIAVAGQNVVVICSGFQLTLNLLLALLWKPGDVVAVENPTFNSVLNLLDARGIPHRGIPMEHDGLDVDCLERLLKAPNGRERPRLLITIPTLHNPTGVTMSREKRERLMALTAQHGVPVIEDNWAMFLGPDGRAEPSLKALDGAGQVIQIGSISKAFLPGTRIAWAVLPKEVAVSFTKAKRAMDRSDSYFLQTLVYEFIKKGYMDLHCRKVERIYRARRELTDELMRQHFPSEVGWKRPQGGFSFWVNLPAWLDSRELLKYAIQCGVEFAPGNYFYVGRRDACSFRLAFSPLTQPQIRQGIKRLGQALSQAFAARQRERRPS